MSSWAHQLKLVSTGEELRTQVKSCLSLSDRGPYPCPYLCSSQSVWEMTLERYA